MHILSSSKILRNNFCSYLSCHVEVRVYMYLLFSFLFVFLDSAVLL